MEDCGHQFFGLQRPECHGLDPHGGTSTSSLCKDAYTQD